MAKNTKNTPATVAQKEIKITAKTKFPKNSVEAVVLKDIKARERKIDKAQRSLVSLWIAQGKELNEFMAITGVSQRLAAEMTGVKRTMVNTYCTIANDPRMLNEEFQEQLEQFSQKELIKLTKIDDEELFDKALEDGELPSEPKADKPHPITDVEPEPVAQPKWVSEMHAIVDSAADFYAAKEAMLAYLATEEDDDVEAEIEAEDPQRTEDEKILAEAIALTGEDEIGAQAKELGIKKATLETALEDGIMSKGTVKKLKAYIAS